MELTGILKVTPEQMRVHSTRFGTSAMQVHNKTNQMLNTVSSLNRSWQGEASNTYRRKFNELRDDMERMFKMIKEHSEDLRKMAENYQRAEETNKGNFSGLAEDVIV